MRLRIEAGLGDYEGTNSRDPVGETKVGCCLCNNGVRHQKRKVSIYARLRYAHLSANNQSHGNIHS
jgi:hypothetical protein